MSALSPMSTLGITRDRPEVAYTGEVGLSLYVLLCNSTL